mmetsp:Transcript_36346/g.67174  ORF Transcript_36346/g.67174 Transcript_36346/m.67174 type:complete len:82 (+) Transcript_36346:299-544(+)
MKTASGPVKTTHLIGNETVKETVDPMGTVFNDGGDEVSTPMPAEFFTACDTDDMETEAVCDLMHHGFLKRALNYMKDSLST